MELYFIQKQKYKNSFIRLMNLTYFRKSQISYVFVSIRSFVNTPIK